MMSPEPLFLLSDVPGDLALVIGSAMSGTIVALAAYIRLLHAQGRADLIASIDTNNKLAEALAEIARATDERTRRTLARNRPA